MFGLSPEILKIISAVLGPLLIFAIIYFKGRSDEKSAVKDAGRKAEKILRKKVHNAEIKNRTIEKSTQEKLDEISHAKSLRQLIRLWNKGSDD